MKLSLALAEVTTRITPRPCGLRQAIEAMDGEDRAAFDKALGDHSLSAFVVSEALHMSGFEVSDQMIRRHRRGNCQSCGRS